MTRLFNDPEDFAQEMIEGFAAASARWVRPVSGGVIRSTRGSEPTVAVVIGGGSGHYPAFGGLVGPGLAHGAAMGNLFASPSARQVNSVAAAASEGRGVLLSFGNYAGDVLHFGQAKERLIAAGIDCRIVLVTDDVSSAPRDEIEKRRGVAGDLVVFKIAGAASAAGLDLDEVERLAMHANDRTRSFGVAFAGCTLPGASEPLFDVAPGRMAIGLGIHGEPGIDEVDVPTAEELAERFVSKLIEEVPDGVSVEGARVVPILNGLGSVKYEELFVVYRSIDRLLKERGVIVVDPEVGEFCTSFDMAGASLTLLWLDDELETLWTAACDTPTFRRGSIDASTQIAAIDVIEEAAAAAIGAATDDSRALASTIGRALDAMASMLDEQADELGRIDRIAGDGDHGIGMQRGSKAAAAAANAAIAAGAGARTALALAGDDWADFGGGTSGAIWGEMLIALGAVFGDDQAATDSLIGEGVTAMKTAIMSFGKAVPGDKTMIDAIVPFADTLAEGLSTETALVDAWSHAADVAKAAADETANMVAKLGRSRAHGDKSLGTADPGAVSFSLITYTVLSVLKEDN